MATGEMDYYFRDDVRQALVRFSKNREAVAKNHDTFFKRPDTLSYANDVDYLIKKGATSFHVSEEIWDNPLAIQTGEKKKDLDDKRIGWDLILDVDCKFWKWAKKITHRLIEELKAHGIKSISCKFSGNKGFHIAVPWECFPKTFAGKKTSDLFPDLPRRILKYLIDRRLRESITKEIEHDDDEIKEICKTFKITREQLFYEICSNSVCNRKLEIENRKMYCKYCQSSDTTEIKDYIKCNKCGEFFANENIGNDGKTKYKICVCGNDVNLEENRKKITEIKYILDVDAILIAPRHLYRMPYSLHEKSGYVSIPIDINEVLNFNKESAEKEKVVINKFPFLNYIEKDTASKLCIEANDLAFLSEKNKEEKTTKEREKRIEEQQDTRPKQALPVTDFPPCMNNIRQGMKDGRKRASFCYINFLFNIGWTYEEVEKEILDWNKKNGEEPLRENLLMAHLMTYKRSPQRQEIMPPNCDNKSYYEDLGLCHPNTMCRNVKNPVQYTKKIDWIKKKEVEKQTSDTLSDKQILIRKEYRQYPFMVAKIKEFMKKENRLPLVDAKTKKEQELFAWIKRQYEKISENTLNDSQIVELKELKIIN